MTISDEEIARLKDAAQDAIERSHCPYSNYPVGAAVLTHDGSIYSACNIEMKPSTNTLHAEPRAISKAIEDGYNSITALALTTESENPQAPCGNCMQAIATFAESIPLIVEGKDGFTRIVQSDECLPFAYTSRE